MVRDLVDRIESPGFKRVQWDGLDDSGGLVESGVYFYRIKAGDFTESKKMIMVR
jgi:flagellar hook assembly protein FlgD